MGCVQKSDVYMPYVPGHEEDGFLKKLDITPADIEPKADLCTKVSLFISFDIGLFCLVARSLCLVFLVSKHTVQYKDG